MERVEGTCGAEAVTGRTGTGMPCTGSTAQRRAVGFGVGRLWELPVGVGCCQHQSRNPE